MTTPRRRTRRIFPRPSRSVSGKPEALHTSVNVGTFIGQGSTRSEVIGEVNRPAKDDELRMMRGLVEQGMKDGAFGLSTGLFTCPARLRRPTRSSSWRRSPAGSAASTCPTCATRQPGCSIASTRRSPSVNAVVCRPRSRTTRSSAVQTGGRASRRCRPSIARVPAASTSPSTRILHGLEHGHPGSAHTGVDAGGRSQADADPSGDAGTRAKVKGDRPHHPE